MRNVQLAQAVLLLRRLEEWVQDIRREERGKPGVGGPEIVLCGDFNSIPRSPVYQFLASSPSTSSEKSWSGEDEEDMHGDSDSAHSSSGSSVKVLLDGLQLLKIAKWLRAMGIDAALVPFVPPPPTSLFSSSSSPSSPGKTSKEAKNSHASALLDKCHAEKRVLITRSKQLIQRKNCPPYFLCAPPTKGRNKKEERGDKRRKELNGKKRGDSEEPTDMIGKFAGHTKEHERVGKKTKKEKQEEKERIKKAKREEKKRVGGDLENRISRASGEGEEGGCAYERKGRGFGNERRKEMNTR